MYKTPIRDTRILRDSVRKNESTSQMFGLSRIQIRDYNSVVDAKSMETQQHKHQASTDSKIILVGAELELLLEKDGKPMSWADWKKLMPVIDRLTSNMAQPKIDTLTNELLGFEVNGLGVLTCDSSASQAELAADPKSNKKELLEALENLYNILDSALSEIGANIRWGSQYPGRISEEDYKKRVASKGVYAVLRKVWGWKHHEMHLSAAFQPAVDIEPENAAAYLNSIYATSPLAIMWFGGSSPSKGNEECVYYEYRMHGWTRMLTNSKEDKAIIGVKRFEDSKDYLDSLLKLKARVIALSHDYKTGSLAFFAPNVTGYDVLNGTTASLITGILDLKNDKVSTEEIQVSGINLLNQMDWWAFWDARWRFKINEDGSYAKSYIEVRNMGTPDSYGKLEPILDFFIALRHNYDKVNEMATSFGIWSNISDARESAIRYGTVPANHIEFLKYLTESGIMPRDSLHSAKHI